MGFFRKVGNAFVRFMYGRNGPDKLGMWSVWISVILNLVSSFLMRHHRMPALVLYYLAMGLMLWAMFRMFSKNLGKRREENQKFVNWLWRMKSSRSGARERHADKEHKYFTCKNCGTVCRVPVGKGKIIITCPKCGAEIHGKT